MEPEKDEIERKETVPGVITIERWKYENLMRISTMFEVIENTYKDSASYEVKENVYNIVKILFGKKE